MYNNEEIAYLISDTFYWMRSNLKWKEEYEKGEKYLGRTAYCLEQIALSSKWIETNIKQLETLLGHEISF